MENTDSTPVKVSSTYHPGLKKNRSEFDKNEEIFALLVDAVDEYAIFALSPEGIILTWNAGGERLKGYKPDEVIGTHFSRFYTPADLARNHPAHELELAAENGKYEEEGWRIKKDGTMFWANVVITALYGDNGKLRGFGKVTRDLTQKRESELALRESEERFRLLVSNVRDYAIITLDTEGHIVTWNPGAERIKGYRSKDIVGKHFSAFYPRSEIENGKPEMELRIAAEGGCYEEEGWRVRKDGTMFWADVTITAMKDDGGTLKGFAKVTRDLTSRRQAEEALRQSQERYRMLIDNISDYAVIFLDAKGRITSWNMGAKKITGYDSKEILGSHVSKFYTAEDIASRRYENEFRVATETGRYEEEGVRVRKNGERYWANVVITSVKDDFGNLLGFSKVTRDLTEKKKAEDALRDAYNDLERRIEIRTEQFAQAKARAEAAVKTRDEFFSMASHELKTPLASLKMQAQIRKRNVKRGDLKDFAPEKLEALCASDERQVERLTFLVDNMLDVSKLTSGTFRLAFDRLQVKELVEDVVFRMEPFLQESKNECRVNIQTDASVVWDRHRIEQVLTNMLSNAGKYAPGKPVDITVAVKDEAVVISVKDLGRGISDEDQKRIFDPFERVEDRGATAGLGLGLYITSQIIAAHGGTIRLESEIGKGSMFIVELPLNAELQTGKC